MQKYCTMLFAVRKYFLLEFNVYPYYNTDKRAWVAARASNESIGRLL